MMTALDEFDRRIARQELELARMQAEETTYRQIEAHFARETLQSTLHTAGVIAATALDVLSDIATGFDVTIQRMADDLNGGADR